MNPCLCYPLYHISKPTKTREYAFSGSLCHLKEFDTLDGSRYCITIFSLSDYKHLHFPHEEYQILMTKLQSLLSTHAIMTNTKTDSTNWRSNERTPSITLLPFFGDFKVKLGIHSLTIGKVTAFGLLKTSPFTNDDVTDDEKRFQCDLKWDICACKSCPIFKQLIDFEAAAKKKFPHRKPVTIII